MDNRFRRESKTTGAGCRRIMVKSFMSDLFLMMAFLVLTVSVGSQNICAAAIAEENKNTGNQSLLQFKAAGHVLGFGPGEMYVAGSDHALRVGFVGALPVSPTTGAEEVRNDPDHGQGATVLSSVTYPGLWEGVNLVFEKEDHGLVKSTYHIAKGSGTKGLDKIRLAYNVPVTLDKKGQLILAFERGQLIESAPVAWQEIGEERVPVKVAFKMYKKQEVGFQAGHYDPAYPLVIDPVLTWNSFMGSTGGSDDGWVIAVDDSENVYMTGRSSATWGAPVNAYTGGNDVFVTKLDSSGNRVWNTFMGSAEGNDRGYGLFVDSAGNVYVSGYSDATWGAPIDDYTGGNDAYAAKLDSSGNRVWNTFMGSTAGRDRSRGIAVDSSGNVYVVGYSDATWGAPIDDYAGASDAYAAKLDGSGNRVWNTFMGSAAGDDYGWDIALDGSGDVYVTGRSTATWGAPIDTYIGSSDAYVVKLDGNGNRVWNTFMGSTGFERAYSLCADSLGNVYVTGYSDAAWGAPIDAYTGGNDAFVARLDGNGNRAWNTFMGSAGGDDRGFKIVADDSGNVYVAGYSDATWGTSIEDYTGGNDVFVSRLDSSGNRSWNSFIGSTAGDDKAYGIAADTLGNIYFTGYSDATWGTPIDAYTGGWDAFGAKMADIRVTSTNAAISDVTVANTIASAPADFETQFGIEFTATEVNGTADISIAFPFLPETPYLYKVIRGIWTLVYPVNNTNGITNVAFNGKVLTFSIEDNSDADTDDTFGTIKDPVVVGFYSGSGSSSSGGCFISTIEAK